MLVHFTDLNISKAILNAIEDIGFTTPTPIQEQSYSVILSGKNVVGIAQTGTGKTWAYLLPILNDLKYSKELKPRVLIVVPTRELVNQVVEQLNLLTAYMTVRILGVYGGVNINTQKAALAEGVDILVATPRRLYDLAVNRAVQLQDVKKLVIDEVDVMLDLGFLFQLTNLFELLPEKRQNIMFSATMTEEVATLIEDFFIAPVTISITLSGTPLQNIEKQCYSVANFYTKISLLIHLLKDKETFKKVVVFIDTKKHADLLFDELEQDFWSELGVIHSNKSQNNREATIERFNDNASRILIATDVIARGLDLDRISHVISFDVPAYPENYIHRIGRTGRAQNKGNAILFYTKDEERRKEDIEKLMDYTIPFVPFPNVIPISKKLILEEQPVVLEKHLIGVKRKNKNSGFHEKKDKNKKTAADNVGGGDKIKMKKAKKYKSAKTRGDKFGKQNKKRK
jgi:ATP-dependent RNA helicase RhlE